MKILLLVVAAIVVYIVLGFFALGAYFNYQNANYYKNATPAGEIEKKYTAMGELDVSYKEFEAKTDAYGKYEVWYPTELTQPYPPNLSHCFKRVIFVHNKIFIFYHEL